MKPIDPRLLRYARTTRTFLAATFALGLASAALVITQATLIADITVRSFQQHETRLGTPLLLLAATALGRALVAWLTELAAHRTSAAVKSELRTRLLAHASTLGSHSPSTHGLPQLSTHGCNGGAGEGGTGVPAARVGDVPPPAPHHRTGELAALATRGIDALDGYFARYLPQLGLAVAVPVAVIARVLCADWISALVIVATLPLIPLFAALIGWATETHTSRQWRLLARLSGHFLDVVEGLPTLKVFGRAKAQADNIRAITGDYRRATLRTLRIAFLSSFALELLATLSVALVAVDIGIRLVHGQLDLRTGLLVLILAPEAYLPLRQAGAQYHAAAEGLAAADEVFTVLETPLPPAGTRPAPDLRTATVTFDGVRVRHPGRAHDSLPTTELTLRPGHTLALTGPSGSGKTTLLHTFLGLTRPSSGRIRVDGTDLADIEKGGWHAQIAWVPQHPHLFAGTVAENVRLARPDSTEEDVKEALRTAGADELDPSAVLGEGGGGISTGQRQRVALARAFLSGRPLLVLDEPTAALDAETEAAVAASVRRLAQHRTVLLTAHRPALLRAADTVIALTPPAAEPPVGYGPPAGEAARDAAVRAVPAVRALPAVRAVPTAVRAVPTAVRALPTAVRAVPEGALPAQGPREVGVRETGPRETGVRASRARGSAVSQASPRPGAPEVPVGGPPADVHHRVRPPRARLALAGVLGTLALLSATGLMATSGWLISRASQQPPILYLMVAVTATRTFGIGRAAFRYTERLVSHDAVLRALAVLRAAVYRRLEQLAPAGLREARRGDLLTRLVGDVDAQQDHHLRWLLPAATATVASLAAVAFLTALLPAAGAVLAAGLLVAGLAVPALTGALSRRTESRLAPARAALATRTVELLTGTAELTVAGALPARTAAARDADTALTRIAGRSAAATALGTALSTLATGLTVTAAAWTGVHAVGAGRLHGVWLAAVVLTPLAAAEAVAGLPLAVQYRQRTARSAARIREVLDAPVPVREPASVRDPVPVRDPLPVRDTASRKGPRAWREPASVWEQAEGDEGEAGRAPGIGPSGPSSAAGSSGAAGSPGPSTMPFPLVVSGLTARYPGGDAQGPAPLDGFDLRLTPGRRVAIVGASGSGKTTLAYALLRFLDPQYGTYTLGGRPATGLASDAVRRYVGLCAQDAHIFDSTLRENLRLALPRDAGGEPLVHADGTRGADAVLWRALAAARLDDWAAGLPDGLDTLVGEHGARLSGGQRQRLALARALLADFPVLVLDEPAEHLDLPTADALTADLLALSAGRTAHGRATVLITHRLHGLEAVDEIVVLEGGRSAQRGTYARLADTDGPFARMLVREREGEGCRAAEAAEAAEAGPESGAGAGAADSVGAGPGLLGGVSPAGAGGPAGPARARGSGPAVPR